MSIRLVSGATDFRARSAIVDGDSTFTYGDLLEASAAVASGLLAGAEDLGEERVAFLVPSGFHYVATLWGIWRAGGIAVPSQRSALADPSELPVFAH